MAQPLLLLPPPVSTAPPGNLQKELNTLLPRSENTMNTPTQNLGSSETPILFFEPRNPHEEVTAKVVRMMIEYEVLRVQLESNLMDFDGNQRTAKRQEAIQLRITGFRTQRESAEHGMPFTLDDELLRREAVRIAYLLARNATEEAKRIEEQVVTISVNQALYGMDDELITIANAA